MLWDTSHEAQESHNNARGDGFTTKSANTDFFLQMKILQILEDDI